MAITRINHIICNIHELKRRVLIRNLANLKIRNKLTSQRQAQRNLKAVFLSKAQFKINIQTHCNRGNHIKLKLITFLRQTTSSAPGFSVVVFVLRGFHEQGFSAILCSIKTILEARLHTIDHSSFVLRWNIFFDIFNRGRGLASNSHLLRGGSWNSINCRAGGRGTGHFHGSRAREKKFSIERFAEKPCWQSLLAGAAKTELFIKL